MTADLTKADGADSSLDDLLDDPAASAAAPAEALGETVLPAAAPPKRRLRFGRVARIVTGLFLVVLVVLGWSIRPYLTAPGTDSTAARLAGWARDHHLGGLVNWGERVQYDLHKPRTGGTPSGGVPLAGPTAPPVAKPVRHGTPAPAPITPFASPALQDEGVWQTLLSVKGEPAVRAAFVRPDAVHTSYLTAVAWMDPKLVRFELHPGTSEPGGTWRATNHLTQAQLPGLLAAFNSGFKLDGARGGYYAEGRVARKLRDGAASMVIYRDGHANVLQWGRDAHLGPDVVAVRQNLDLLVDNGQLAPHIDENNGQRWGWTLGDKAAVWRSGVGITKTGAIVYAAGNSLTVRTIAQVLQAAGAVRAMELDINPEWTTFDWFSHDAAAPSDAVPHRLARDMQKPADHYLHTSTRDFFAVYAR